MNDDPLASIIAAMWSEYYRDEMCDNSRIIRLMVRRRKYSCYENE